MAQLHINYFALSTIKSQPARLVTQHGLIAARVVKVDAANDLAIRRALEAAGVEFIDENGGGAGVRFRQRSQPPNK